MTGNNSINSLQNGQCKRIFFVDERQKKQRNHNLWHEKYFSLIKVQQRILNIHIVIRGVYTGSYGQVHLPTVDGVSLFFRLFLCNSWFVRLLHCNKKKPPRPTQTNIEIHKTKMFHWKSLPFVMAFNAILLWILAIKLNWPLGKWMWTQQ